jgi:hypothetical protein
VPFIRQERPWGGLGSGVGEREREIGGGRHNHLLCRRANGSSNTLLAESRSRKGFRSQGEA